MTVLEVRNLRLRFDTPEGPLQALDEVSFRMEPGETTALVGESGSGKSVTALCLMGLLPPQAVVETGEVLLEGRNLLALPERELRGVRGRKLAMVYQDATAALHPLMTIGRQLSEVLEVHDSVSREEARARCAEALAEVGMPDPLRQLDSYPHQLSGGMRQRAMIAMALLARPQVLIADEPTTALDVTVQAQVLDLLGGLQRRHGTAILLITHDLGVVARAAARVLVMYAGRVVESAEVRELYRAPLHPYTLGLLQGAASAAEPASERRLFSIPGEAPDPLAPGAGCAFHPRCPFAREHCRRERPALDPWRVGDRSTNFLARMLVTSARRAACFEMERVAAASQARTLAREELEDAWRRVEEGPR